MWSRCRSGSRRPAANGHADARRSRGPLGDRAAPTARQFRPAPDAARSPAPARTAGRRGCWRVIRSYGPGRTYARMGIALAHQGAHPPADAVLAALARATATATGSLSTASTRAGQQFRRGDRQDAGAAAEIEHPAPPAPPGQPPERQQAALGGGMLAGAEGEPGIELDRQRARRRRPADMTAVDPKAPDRPRREALGGVRQPVGRRHRHDRQVEPRQARRFRQRGEARRQRLAVGLRLVQQLDPPAARVPRPARTRRR